MTSSTPRLQQRTSSMSLLNIQNATADLTACTFAIRNEDHTLGNVIRHTLIQNEQNIEFAGYSVPHPSEPIVQIRVQTRTDKHPKISTKQYTAPQALQEACDTVSKQCDFVLNQLEQLLPYVKEDRIQMEQYYLEQNEEELEDDEQEEEVVEEDAADDEDEMVEDMTMDD